MTEVDWEQATEPDDGAELAPGSLIADLRRRADELRADDHVDLDVPGYHGRLRARYKALDRRQMDPIIERAQRRGAATNAMADGLALALVELFGVGDAGELQPLFLDRPARFDMDLAEALNLKPGERSARGVMLALFGWPNERAHGLINAQFREYAEWLNGETDGDGNRAPAQGVVDRAVGEFQAG